MYRIIGGKTGNVCVIPVRKGSKFCPVEWSWKIRSEPSGFYLRCAGISDEDTVKGGDFS